MVNLNTNISNIQQKVSVYLQNNPSYISCSLDKLSEILLKNGVLTANEIEILKNTPLLTFSSEECDSPWGNSLALGDNANKIQSQILNNQDLLGVELDESFVIYIRSSLPPAMTEPPEWLSSSGTFGFNSEKKVDLSQFSVTNLQQKYPPDKYELTRSLDLGGSSTVRIADKFTGEDVLRLEINEDNIVLTEHISKNPPKSVSRSIDAHDGTILSYSYTEQDADQNSVTHVYDGKTNKLLSQSVVNSEIYYETSFDEDGLVVSESFSTRKNATDAFDVVFSKVYEDGVLVWEEDAEGNISIPILDDFAGYVDLIIRDEGYLREDESVEFEFPNMDILISQIEEVENVELWIAYYEEKTGMSFPSVLKSLSNCGGENAKSCKVLLEKLEPKVLKTDKQGANYLAAELTDSFDAEDKKDFMTAFEKIEPKHLRYLIPHFTMLAGLEKEFEEANTLADALKQGKDSKFAQFAQQNFDNMPNGLLDIINQATFLSDSEKKSVISKIIDMSLEGLPPDDVAEFRKDIASHPNDYKKVEIDLLRAANRVRATSDIDDEDSFASPANGKFDNFAKQGSEGDCWLIAGVNSIIAKPAGKQMLESLFSFDPQTGNVTVCLKGVGKSYTITPEEIQNANHLSSGDGDMRALEIAIDRCLKELAYDKNYIRMTQLNFEGDVSHDLDLHAGTFEDLYKLLFDNATDVSSKIDPATTDFSNEKSAYSFALVQDGAGIEDETKYFAKDSTGKKVPLHNKHAYSVVGSNKTHIFISNPWNPADILYVSREDLSNIPSEFTGFSF